ncbi:unnamed protein product [Schistosoma margrebowiei]|uniref:Uncharacterized protein n=1 Tax=Schistosoma margrebowiei TaxID=48269 RepID=A0A3P8FN08_9TREM|nr:unnamed protein product [Schistosoma margrebowiei]
MVCKEINNFIMIASKIMNCQESNFCITWTLYEYVNFSTTFSAHNLMFYSRHC